MYFIFFSPVFIEQDLVHSQKYIYNKQKWEISFYCCFYVLIILFPRNLGILRLSLYLVKCSRFYKRMQWNSANCLKYFPFRSTFGFVSLQSLVFCVVFSGSLFVLFPLAASVLTVILQFTDPDYPFGIFKHCVGFFSFFYFLAFVFLVVHQFTASGYPLWYLQTCLVSLSCALIY